MKFLILLLIPTLCFAAPKHPTPTPISKGPIEKQGMVCRPKQQDLELRDWIGGLINEVHKAQADTKLANDSNAKTKANLDQANTDLSNLKKEMGEGQQCVAHPFSFWFHRLLKHIFILGAILIVVLIAVTILAPGVMPLIVSFFTFIWKWIVALFSPKPKV